MQHYLNPVYNHAFPDPFVLKFCGEYWAYCTGVWPNGRMFGILHSPDLVQWREVGGAMAELPGSHTCYWAPEVSYWNGRFYLYYSVGNETLMQIRVAVADHPAGPFVDSGQRLTREDFAIDAHVFQDDDGARYLFYATDFLDHSHIGTGTVMDRMVDPFTLAGQPHPVTRARYDWQVYDPQRREKGGVRWHTVEGPFVLKHQGRYYQMFSGGNWQNVSYGVSYAWTDDITTLDEWTQVADGERVLPVLRSVPGQVIGPGHNSVVRGPDNQQLFCVYHQWAQDGRGRVMSIDRLDFVDDRLVVMGPSTTPQPAPALPDIVGFGPDRSDGLGPGWRVRAGRWSVAQGIAVQTEALDMAGTELQVDADTFCVEVSLRSLGPPEQEGCFGIDLLTAHDLLLSFRVWNDSRTATLTWGVDDQDDPDEMTLSLPPDFDPRAYHLLRVEVAGRRACVSLDGIAAPRLIPLKAKLSHLALTTTHLAATFAGFALTVIVNTA